MKFKRKKCRRSVRCTMCTPDRWKGNTKDRFDANTKRKIEKFKFQRFSLIDSQIGEP